MIITIIIAKMISFALHLFHRGATTLPGKVALKLKPSILSKLAENTYVICVTGTNGKTTTCALIESSLSANGFSCFLNKSGANMITGVATSFIVNSSIKGKCKYDYAILECDENSLTHIADYISADIVVVTNVFRDQLDRYGEVSYTLSKIKEGINKMDSPVLVLNADCPLTASLHNSRSITFGINIDCDNSIVSDSPYCPFCSNELYYDSIVYSQLGCYKCLKCGYYRRKPTFSISQIFDDNTFVLNDKLVNTSLSGIYNLYNYLAAYSVAECVGIDNTAGLSDFSGAFGRMESFTYMDKVIKVLLVKNPVGLSNCIKYVSSSIDVYDMYFLLNDNSADGIDVSWIWDSSFIELKDRISSAYTFGTRAYDMSVRLKYDDIKSTAYIGENYHQLIDLIKSSNKDSIVFATYTAMMKLRHYLVSEFGGDEFWE